MQAYRTFHGQQGPCAPAPSFGPDMVKTDFGYFKRRKLNLSAVCANSILPWVFFFATNFAMSFGIRDESPNLVLAMVGCMLLLPAGLAFIGYRAKRDGHDESWYFFSAAAFSLAILAGAFIGNCNYQWNLSSFYDVTNLHIYNHTNPLIAKGSEMVDAGRVYFEEGTHLDMSKSSSLSDRDTFCVVPIVIGNTPMPHFDFWAVGKNCCGKASRDYTCGEYNNPKARAGIRLVRDNDRAYYRLAVQQAEAAHRISAPHPLFFHWVEEPRRHVEASRDKAMRFMIMSCAAYFAFNVATVVGAVFIFSKMGHV